MECEKCPVREECEIMKELAPSITACPLVQAMIDGVEKLFRSRVVQRVNKYFTAREVLDKYLGERSGKKPEPPEPPSETERGVDKSEGDKK